MYYIPKYYQILSELTEEWLSFNGPATAYDDIYNSRLDKDAQFYRAFGQEGSTFTISKPSHAKPRKDLILPFFSRRSILSLEHIVQEKVRGNR